MFVTVKDVGPGRPMIILRIGEILSARRIIPAGYQPDLRRSGYCSLEAKGIKHVGRALHRWQTFSHPGGLNAAVADSHDRKIARAGVRIHPPTQLTSGAGVDPVTRLVPLAINTLTYYCCLCSDNS